MVYRSLIECFGVGAKKRIQQETCLHGSQVGVSSNLSLSLACVLSATTLLKMSKWIYPLYSSQRWKIS